MKRLLLPTLTLLLLAHAAGCKRQAGDATATTPPPLENVAGAPDAGPAPTTDGARVSKSGVRLATPTELEGTTGLVFRLAEGKGEAAREEVTPVAPATPLSSEETAKLLARLPPLEAKAGDVKDFAMREKSLPPPKTGEVVKETFPPKVAPDAAKPTAEAGPLTVTRYMPEGEVSLAPELSVSFSEPMVPVGTVAAVASESRPVKLEPEPPGQWRWVGTKTLLFRPTVDRAGARFPMATSYRVTVPKGVRSATGQVLAAEKSWTFATPPPTVTTFYPSSGPVALEPVMAAVFDQAIDADAVLDKVTVEVLASPAGGAAKKLAIQRVPAEEAKKDRAIQWIADSAEANRWVAFRVTERLPAASDIRVTFGPGTPSAEGPRTTAEARSFTFNTFDKLKVVQHRCGWGEACRPRDQFSIWLSNPIDAEKFDPTTVKVTPEIPGLKVTTSGNQLELRGATKGRTQYRVQLPAELPDMFGQTLGSSEPLTFDVGSADKMLYAMGQQMQVLDPAGKPNISVYSTNFSELRVRVHAVSVEQWGAFLTVASSGDDKPLPGKTVYQGTVKVAGDKDELVETRVDLSRWLDQGLGHLVVDIRPPDAELTDDWMKQNPPRVRRWVQSTKLGLDAFLDPDALTAWVSELGTGAPITGADVTVRPHGLAAKSDARGLASFPLPPEGPEGAGIIVARLGKDVAFLSETTWDYRGRSGWQRRTAQDWFSFWVIDDRGMYRPGEQVHLKGWVRKIGGGKLGDVEALPAGVQGVSFSLTDSRGNVISSGTKKIGGLGGFELVLTLPKTMNLGEANVELRLDGNLPQPRPTASHSFEVEEFRRPEFEVSATASEGPHVIGGRATATVHASYYAGGGLPNAETTWNVSASPGQFTPPNRSDWTFGQWVPWWGGGWDLRREISGRGRLKVLPYPGGLDESAQYRAFQGRTDASGEHSIAIELAGVSPPRPMSVHAEATVMDVNRQAWTASTLLLVHPATHYVGLKVAKPFVLADEPVDLSAIVVDLDGRAIPNRPVALRVVRLEWQQTKGEWKEAEVDEMTETLTSANDGVSKRLALKNGGRWRITATISDDEGRKNETTMMVWVAGEKLPPRRAVEQEQVELIPDKAEYRDGDVARILVRAPFAPAEGIFSVRRGGVLSSERFTMKEPSYVLELPVRDAWVSGVTVDVELVGSAVRTDDLGTPKHDLPRRPAYASGQLALKIPPYQRTLAVSAVPKDSRLEPGGSTTVDVTVLDAEKKPVAGAEVLLFVVDEAVLALSNYRLANPLDTFYTMRGNDVRDYHSRSAVLLASALDLDAAAAMIPPPAPPGGVEYKRARNGHDLRMQKPMAEAAAKREADGAADDGASSAPIALRTNLDPLAIFAPALVTSADGRVSVPVKLPDNLTRYRVMAVAAAGAKSFGTTESSITARKPLMVRPSLPRFLNFGDEFEVAVVIQNQTSAPVEARIAVRATNAELTAGQGKSVKIPADDRVEVRFPARAARPGTARFQLATASGTFADAAELSLPVWTPATTEAFATYGEVDRGAIAQVVEPPTDAVPEFGGLEITTSSTQLQALTDAVVYLVQYPFECSEQLASRIISIAALKDVLNAFEAKGMPGPKETKAAVARDIERLRGMQNGDGGFAFWTRGEPSWPFNSIHAAHALARAKEKRFDVPAEMVQSVLRYLKNIDAQYPASYGPETRRVLTAYALYTRQLLDDRDPKRARAIISEAGGVEKLPIEALGWLYPVLTGDAASAKEVAAIRRVLANRVTETAGTAHFVTSYGDQGYLLLHSDRRADGVLLYGLIGDQPKSDLIPKIVRGLLAHRVRGRWPSTQDNVWVLLALDRYFQTYEKTPPSFVARVWLGDRFAGEHTFRGHTTESDQIDVPMSWVAKLGAGAKDGKETLTVQKDGTGRLYYRVGLTYAPKSLALAPSDQGFTVERRYEAIDDPRDVKKDDRGVWHVRAGARVRVVLTMSVPARRYHVALVDPLPAGLEAVNPALAVSGSVPDESPRPTDALSRYWWWYRPWYEHQNLRDERVEAFTSLLWEGVHEYTYVARATTFGSFVVPPTKAEEMYAPETFGRSGSDRLIVD